MSDYNEYDMKQEASTDSGTPSHEEKRPFQDDPTNLIVNYLPVYFTEDHLRELFSQYGHIESLIVMYNKHDFRKKSKGYGFVKFASGHEAAAAIKGVDGTRIANKTIKVSVARPGRARRSSNVFVSRLPVSWKDADLHNAFKPFGHIVECRVLTFGDGVSRRCGFVRYDSDDEAKLAMKRMKQHRPTPRDAPLQVNLSVNHSPDAREIERRAFEKELAMRHRDPLDFMSPWMRRSDFYSSSSAMHRLSPYDDDDFMLPAGRRGMMDGPLDYAPLMHDAFPSHHAPPPRGGPYFPEDYGSNSTGAGPYGGDYHPPIRGMNPNSKEFVPSGKSDYGWNASVETKPKYMKNSSDEPIACAGGISTKAQAGLRLFVQNLPDFYDESHLKQLFSSYGEITDVTIQKDRRGNSIRCGFVNFTASDHATNAIEALDGVMLSTQTLVIHSM